MKLVKLSLLLFMLPLEIVSFFINQVLFVLENIFKIPGNQKSGKCRCRSKNHVTKEVAERRLEKKKLMEFLK